MPASHVFYPELHGYFFNDRVDRVKAASSLTLGEAQAPTASRISPMETIA